MQIEMKNMRSKFIKFFALILFIYFQNLSQSVADTYVWKADSLKR